MKKRHVAIGLLCAVAISALSGCNFANSDKGSTIGSTGHVHEEYNIDDRDENGDLILTSSLTLDNEKYGKYYKMGKEAAESELSVYVKQ